MKKKFPLIVSFIYFFFHLIAKNSIKKTVCFSDLIEIDSKNVSNEMMWFWFVSSFFLVFPCVHVYVGVRSTQRDSERFYGNVVCVVNVTSPCDLFFIFYSSADIAMKICICFIRRESCCWWFDPFGVLFFFICKKIC